MTSDTNESQKFNQHFYMDSYSIVPQGESQIVQHLPQNGQQCTGMSRTRAAAAAAIWGPGAGSVLDNDESRWLWH